MAKHDGPDAILLDSPLAERTGNYNMGIDNTSQKDISIDFTEVILGQLRRLEDVIAILAEEIAARKTEQQHAEEPHAYTVQQAAERLGVGPGLVRGWIRNGKLAAFDASKVSHALKPRMRIRRADLETFILSRMVQPPPVFSARRPRTSAARRRAIEQAERELREAGI